MKMLNFPEMADTILQRIDNFFRLINSLFEETGKNITIDPQNNAITFSLKGTKKNTWYDKQL
ncbi:MAG: hypothetical protein LUD46_06425 [Parabacteroides sp.]|nr:hypothetical protein [Parabacteroides sp.]